MFVLTGSGPLYRGVRLVTPRFVSRNLGIRRFLMGYVSQDETGHCEYANKDFEHVCLPGE